MRVHILINVTSAGKGTILLTTLLRAVLTESHHVGPDLIDISGVRIINHVWGVSSCWAHIHLQGDEITFSAKSIPVAVETEELKMHKAVPNVKCFYRAPSELPQTLRNLPVHIIRKVKLKVDDVHDGWRPNGHRLKERITLSIDDGIITADLTCNELLNHIIPTVAHCLKKSEQLAVVLYLVSIAGTHAHIWFGNDGISHQFGKFEKCIYSIGSPNLTSRRNISLGIELLHLGLLLDATDTV